MKDKLTDMDSAPRLEFLREMLGKNPETANFSEEEIQAEERRLMNYARLVKRIAERKIHEEHENYQ